MHFTFFGIISTICIIPLHSFIRPLTNGFVINRPYHNNPTYLSSARQIIPSKIEIIGKLMRVKSVLPTAILSLMGGLINCPNIVLLLQSKSFLASAIITQCIMTGSMVINDIFDMQIDSINHPQRPLVSGAVTVKEAILITIGLFGTAQLLSLRFLSTSLQMFVSIVIWTLILYTPFYKYIPFVKNFTCSSIVSGIILFSGYSVSGSFINPLLFTMTKLIFVCSLYIELLLDIYDSEGDRQNSIYTLPVLLSKDSTTCITFAIITLGAIDIVNQTIRVYPKIVPFGFACVYLPFFVRLWECKRENYSASSIKRATRNTMPSLILALFIIMYISTKMIVKS